MGRVLGGSGRLVSGDSRDGEGEESGGKDGVEGE